MNSEFFELRPKKYTTKLQLYKRHDKAIVFRHGHIAITDYHMGDNPEFEKALSVWNETRWRYELKGGYYVAQLHEFRVNRGYEPAMLGKFFPGYTVVVENDAYPADKVKIDLLCPPRDDFQRVALTFMCCQGDYTNNARYTQQLIDAETGDGKSQPDDTMIPTPTGLRRLDSLRVGDYVYNRLGKPVKILNIYPQDGLQDTYRVTLADGRSTRCNGEHLWTVQELTDKKLKLPSAIPLSVIMERMGHGSTYIIPCCFEPDNTYHGATAITSIEQVDPSYQRCVLIDDPEHIYLTENYIPTHNTYLGTATPCFMSARSVIIVPFSKLLEQWKNSFLTFTSLKEDEILIVQGSSICKKIIDGEYPDVKVFIFLVDTIDAFHKKHGDLETIELLRATNAYIKIVDEIHRDMKIISMIEALSNFHMNFYMSASPGRTQKKENWIFKTCFKNLPKFGSGFKVKEERHLNIIVKRYRFTPTPAQIKRMVHPQKKWLNSKSYERELIHAPDEQKADFINSLKAMLKWSKGLLKKGNKILILSDTVEGTEFTNNIANEIFPNQTARYYGAMKDADKKKALEATVICATVLSLGTGADIPGIQHVYNITTYSSQISAIQTAGRARKLKDGTMVFYIELVNMSYLKTFRQYEARKPNLIKKSKTGKIMLID